MKYVASNYGSIGTLDDAITSSETEFDVTGSSAKLANLASGEGYLLCLGDPAGTREFIRCSTFSSDHFSGVTRGFESAKNGGIARGWPSGTPVTMIISAAYLDNIIQKGGIDWDDYPIGHAQPYIETVIGVDIGTFLAAHPKWSSLTSLPWLNLGHTVTGDSLKGRAMAVASATHIAQSQSGSDDAIVVAHTHTSVPHNHAVTDNANSDAGSGYLVVGGLNPEGTPPTTDNTTVIINSTGGPSTDANIQRTQYLDWIIKVS